MMPKEPSMALLNQNYKLELYKINHFLLKIHVTNDLEKQNILRWIFFPLHTGSMVLTIQTRIFADFAFEFVMLLYCLQLFMKCLRSSIFKLNDLHDPFILNIQQTSSREKDF